MNPPKHLLALCIFSVMVTACTGSGILASEGTTPSVPPPALPTGTSQSSSPTNAAEHVPLAPTTPADENSATPAAQTTGRTASCPVTFPNGSQPPHELAPELVRSAYRHGNGELWADLGPGGKIIPAPEQFQEDGSLRWKMGWNRGVRGTLTVMGRRLDAPAPPAQGHYESEGYGDLGFQAGWIDFPSEGCWEITGSVGEASLTFVTQVVRVPFQYWEPAWLPEGLSLRDQDVGELPESFRFIFAAPVWRDDRVTWGEDVLIIETSRGSGQDGDPDPEAVLQQVTVEGQPARCVRGTWDEQHQWRDSADAGTLEWNAGDFRYRVSHVGLSLRCEDLLRVAG